MFDAIFLPLLFMIPITSCAEYLRHNQQYVTISFLCLLRVDLIQYVQE